MCCVLLYDMIYITSHLQVLSLFKKSSLIWALCMGKTWKLIVFCLPCEFYFVFVFLIVVNVVKVWGTQGMDEQRYFVLKSQRVSWVSITITIVLIIMSFWIWENMLLTGMRFAEPLRKPPSMCPNGLNGHAQMLQV